MIDFEKMAQGKNSSEDREVIFDGEMVMVKEKKGSVQSQ